MKYAIRLFTTSLFLISTPSFAITGYLGAHITPYDVTGCKGNSDDPRCMKIKQIACKSICIGHTQDEDEFGKACKEMCPRLDIKARRKIQKENARTNEPKTRYQ